MRLRSRLLVRTAVTAVLVLPASLLVPLPAASADEPPMVSESAFGYDVSALTRQTLIKSVSAVWEVPTVTRHTPGTDVNQWASDEESWTYISLGDGCSYGCRLEDGPALSVGTESSVSASGVPSYRAWYRLHSLDRTSMTVAVSPGDRVRATIDRASGVAALWRLTLHNLTTGAKATTTTPFVSAMVSAQWLVQPLSHVDELGQGYADGPDLTPVHFDEIKINNANPHLTSGERVVMIVAMSEDVVGAPSLPQPDGNGFGACAWATTCAVPPNF